MNVGSRYLSSRIIFFKNASVKIIDKVCFSSDLLKKSKVKDIFKKFEICNSDFT